jgi:hypothetical protein
LVRVTCQTKTKPHVTHYHRLCPSPHHRLFVSDGEKGKMRKMMVKENQEEKKENQEEKKEKKTAVALTFTAL